ncbi:uncharacterized protein MELLADRAFT_90326 [Melampsora larici-populina 98AG31]|uniref:Uncharacterized protein n=1 Tax=Melampsora larici-populina (strain 98AG31 / pathotype 3-4-7) TaxID=747676 RepID=F4RWJ4_MELLP|nr:uncharacterized protein MELLADRAFT_90326 [Melampsora larici-populina 98AG31]EGG03309.1 hypothetical protein MELLADRAFT_90326 [Melampsora larici-populina 98AG31]
MDNDDVAHWLHHQVPRPTSNPHGIRWPIVFNFVTPTSNLLHLVCSNSPLDSFNNMCPGSGYDTDETPSQPCQTFWITTPLQLDPGMIQPSQDSRRGLFNPSSLTQPPSSSGFKRARSTSRSKCDLVGGHIVPNQGQLSKNAKQNKASSQQQTVVAKPTGSKGSTKPNFVSTASSVLKALGLKGKTKSNQKPKSTASSVTNASGYTNQTKNKASSVSENQVQGPSINLRQDSDDDNAWIRKRSKKSHHDLKEGNDYDDIALYFDEPTPGHDNVSVANLSFLSCFH